MQFAVTALRAREAMHGRLFLMLLRDGGQYVLVFSQAPNGKSNNVNHAEPELLLQAFNQIKV